jgi:hypothetical protein
MGAKTWMLIYADTNAHEVLKTKPKLNREATQQWVHTLFTTEKLEFAGDGSLLDTSPPGAEIHAGCFPGVSIVAAEEFGNDYPSRLPSSFLMAKPAGNIYLHAMHSVVDWFAYACWVDGKLVRSLSLSPDSGILEDIGPHFPFEEPYWQGKHPAVDPEEEPDGYPFPFHPLDLGEAAMLEFFGYQLEGPLDTSLFDPETIPLMKFKRARSRWKFWR